MLMEGKGREEMKKTEKQRKRYSLTQIEYVRERERKRERVYKVSESTYEIKIEK
jgi:hypothetical protein